MTLPSENKSRAIGWLYLFIKDKSPNYKIYRYIRSMFFIASLLARDPKNQEFYKHSVNLLDNRAQMKGIKNDKQDSDFVL